MDHDFVLENFSSAAADTLPNSINFLKAIKYLISDWDRSIKRTLLNLR